MQVIMYREREVPGVGALEDILLVTDGRGELKSNCVPGSAKALADQAVFFGRPSNAEKMSEQAFKILIDRLNSQAVN
ncbi:hypothetical protein [Methylibium petroleiphilum]|uniref:hypothetical protein n=1 Tax=Methylibium petroleiphilum TaxID=105560 RepID=UPI00003CD15D|nr:hypothetical protein [Methylibium petroleiphilum]